MTDGKQKKGLSLPMQVMIALVLGIIVGIMMTNSVDIAKTYIKPFGDAFLALIKMVVVPLVFSSLVVGIGGLDDVKQLGRFGAKTLIYFLCTTAIAITIGLVMANVFNVGGGFAMEAEAGKTIEVAESQGFSQTLINMIPTNPIKALAEGNMLQIIVFAVVLGTAFLMLGERGKKMFEWFNTFADAMYMIVGWVMKVAPIGVFALIVPVIAEYGPAVIGSLLKLVIIVYVSCILHAILVYGSAVSVIGKMNPVKFFKGVFPASITAFSTSSSSGTLPVTMECVSKLGVSKPVYSFVLPLGATINMDGTAIYQGVCAIFIAQVFGINLTLGQQVTIVLSATLASIGTAGVPGAGMVMLAMVLEAVGLPIEGIALVAGVERPLDMMRTSVNVTGDTSCAVVVARTEGEMKEVKETE